MPTQEEYFTAIGQSQSPEVAGELLRKREEEKKKTSQTAQTQYAAVGSSQSPDVADEIVTQSETTRSTTKGMTTRQPAQPLTPQQAAYARAMSQPIGEQARKEQLKQQESRMLDYRRSLADPMYGYLVQEAQRKLQAQAQASRPEFVDPTISEMVKSGTAKLKNEVKLIEKYKEDTGGYDLPNYLRDNPKKKDLLKAYFNPADVDKAAEVAKLPESLYSFKERYYKDKGWTDLDKTNLSPREEGPALRKDAKQLDEVRKEYIKKYGQKAYAGSIAGKTLSFVFSPARALSPDVTIKDITASEWITGGAQVALFVVAPAVGLTARGAAGAVASKTIQLGAGAVFVKDTASNWGSMNPTEKAISVAMDTLIIGSALPGRGAVKVAKGRIKEGIAELKASPEAGALRFDNTKPIIESLEINGVRVPEALKGDIRTTLKNLENSVMVKDDVAILKNAKDLKSLAAKLEDSEVREALTKYADKIQSTPDTYIKVADSAGKSPKRTEDVIRQNRQVVEQLSKNKVAIKTMPKIEGLEDIKISRTTPEQRKAVFDEINKSLKRGSEKRKEESLKKIREKARSEQEESALKQKQEKAQRSTEVEKEMKRVSEEAKKRSVSVGDVNRQIRENLKRIKEERVSTKTKSKTINKTITRLRAAVKQATDTETKTALKQQLQLATETKTKLQQQLKLQTETKTALSQALKSKVDVETKLEVVTKLQQLNEPGTSISSGTTAFTATPTNANVIPREAEVKTTPAIKQGKAPYVPVKETKPYRPVKPAKPLTDNEKRQKIRESNGAIAFRMGQLRGRDRWDVIVNPYQSNEDYYIVLGKAPSNSVIVRGPRSAYKSANILYGTGLNRPINIDIGAMDARLTPMSGSKGVKLDFTPDPKLETTGDFNISKRSQIDRNRVFPLGDSKR